MAGAPLLTPAIVLGTLRYGETSRIVRLATREHGVLSAIAKGALRPKSRFGGSLQLLSEGMAHVLPSRSGDLHTLAAFDLTLLHGGIANDLERFAVASALAEAATRFVPPGPLPHVFESLRDSVALIEVVPQDAIGVVGLRALWRLVGELGLAPAMAQCARDGAALPEGAGDVAFSLRDGGLLCDRCAAAGASTRLSSADREALTSMIVAGDALPLLDREHAAAHRRLFARWVRHYLSDTPMPALEYWQRTDASP